MTASVVVLHYWRCSIMVLLAATSNRQARLPMAPILR